MTKHRKLISAKWLGNLESKISRLEARIMEIKINVKTYEAPDSCPIDGPRKGTLKRHLQQHGVASFLSSDKYGEYAA